MTKTDITRTVAALFCTAVMSATCLFGAIGPAHAFDAKPVAVARPVA